MTPAISSLSYLPDPGHDGIIRWAWKWTAMTLIRFPHGIDTLRKQLPCAAFSRENWAGVTQAIDAMFAGARTTLLRVATQCTERLELALPFGGQQAVFRFGETGPPPGTPKLIAGAVFDSRQIEPFGMPRSQTAWATGLVLHHGAPWTWLLLVESPDTPTERNATAIHTLLRRNADDLRRTFLVSHCLGTPDEPDRETIEASWDPLPFGIALLSDRRTILAANTAAEDMISTRRFFVPPGDTDALRPATMRDRRQLYRAVERVVGGDSDSEALGLHGLRHGAPLPVTLLPCGPGNQPPQTGTAKRLDRLIAVIGKSQQELQACRHSA
ncbi:hypothetical protein N7I30_04720 [Aurantimonas litoralis]|nr:hypothetical protein [Aurantimonas litoralis]